MLSETNAILLSHACQTGKTNPRNPSFIRDRPSIYPSQPACRPAGAKQKLTLARLMGQQDIAGGTYSVIGYRMIKIAH